MERRHQDRRAECRFVRLPEVLRLCGTSRSRLYLAIQEEQFPKPIKIFGRTSCWFLPDVQAWIVAQLPAERRPFLATRTNGIFY